MLAEFQEVTAERMQQLRAMSEADFLVETQTPVGPGTVAEFLRIRIFDAWVHEQDIRRAVGQAGHRSGPVAEHSIGRVAMAMPFVVGRKAQAADGTTVVFEITGDAGRVLPIVTESSRARLMEQPPADPTVHLTMDTETFLCLGCGRWEPAQALASGRVSVQGDRAFGDNIVNQMNFMI